ncbi:hypothetical protein NWQ33_03275 [Mycoplasmopsis cynos]|nr:hypothetical protein [Mycoplasmopsis cynos]
MVPSDQEVSLYLSNIANGVITLDGDNQNIYNDWINALDEYKDVIVKFLSMNTFNLTETKLPKYKNNFLLLLIYYQKINSGILNILIDLLIMNYIICNLHRLLYWNK